MPLIKSKKNRTKVLSLSTLPSLLLTFLLILPLVTLSKPDDNIKVLQNKIERLEKEHAIQKNQMENTVLLYQSTNDRLNNYLSYTANIATIFGILIALAGIYIGFESLKSQKRNNQAIRTLEEAKAYVEGKKNEFDTLLSSKKTALEDDYKKIIDLVRDRLLTDIEVETSKIKRIAELKTEEISSMSMPESQEKTLSLLEKRLEFFENIGIPDDPEILFSKAKILVEKKMYAEANELLEKVVAKVPEHKLAYFHLGYNYGQINNSDKSIENYHKHLSIDPKASGAHNNLALQYKDKGKLLEALEHLEKAIVESPDNELYINNKITVLLKLDSINKVIEAYKKLISIKPGSNYYNLLLKYLIQENRQSEVIAYFDEAIEVFSDNAEFSNQYEFRKATFIGEKGKKDEAINIYQSLISEGYRVEACYINIAELKNDLGDRNSAIEILDNGISSNPLSSLLYINKAFVQLPDGQNIAKNILVEGGEKINNENYYQTAGRFFNLKNEFEIARFCYENAVKISESRLSSQGEPEEGNLLNLYEAKIILGENTNDFNQYYRGQIKSEKYKTILSTLDIFLSISTEFTEAKKLEAIKKLKELNIEAKEEKETGWDFTDMRLHVEKNCSADSAGFVDKMIKYIDREITFESLEL